MTDSRFWLNVIIAAGVLAASAYPVVRFFGVPFGASGAPESAGPPPRPDGAGDSLNRGVWIGGGTFLEGSHNPGKTDNPASPYYTGDERPPRRMAVGGFWIQVHEVTNRECRRFIPGATPVNEESLGIRGGSFRSPPFFLRASNRSNVFYSGTAYDDIGFRVVWPAGAGGD